MKKKNKAFILFFASPAFQSSFDPANPKCFRLVFDAYKKFFAEHGHQRNDKLFAEYYELIVGAFGYQVARLRKTKFITIENPVENYFKHHATRGKSMLHDAFAAAEERGYTTREKSLLHKSERTREVKNNNTALEGRILEIEWELAACQAKIKALELKLKKVQEEKEQPIGKVSDYKESEEYKQAIAENNCFFTYLLDKKEAIYNNYGEYCVKNNFKPVPFPEFKAQMWGDA